MMGPLEQALDDLLVAACKANIELKRIHIPYALYRAVLKELNLSKIETDELRFTGSYGYVKIYSGFTLIKENLRVNKKRTRRSKEKS